MHVASQITDLEFSPPQLIALAKWVAIRLRWPQLAEGLDRDHGLLKVLAGHAYTPLNDPPVGSAGTWFDNADLLEILRDQSIPATRLSTIELPALLRVA